MKTKAALKSLLIVSLTYFFLLIAYLSADTISPGGGGLPMPDMSEFFLIGIAIFSLLAFVFTLIRFCVKDGVSPVGFILHGMVVTGFVIKAVINTW